MSASTPHAKTSSSSQLMALIPRTIFRYRPGRRTKAAVFNFLGPMAGRNGPTASRVRDGCQKRAREAITRFAGRIRLVVARFGASTDRSGRSRGMAEQVYRAGFWGRLPVIPKAVVTGIVIGLAAANVWVPLLLTLGMPEAAVAEAAFLAIY